MQNQTQFGRSQHSATKAASTPAHALLSKPVMTLVWIVTSIAAYVASLSATGGLDLLYFFFCLYCLYQFIKSSFEHFVLQSGGEPVPSPYSDKERANARRLSLIVGIAILGAVSGAVGALSDSAGYQRLFLEAFMALAFHVKWYAALMAAPFIAWFLLTIFALDASGFKATIGKVVMEMLLRVHHMILPLCILMAAYFALYEVQNAVRAIVGQHLLSTGSITQIVIYLAYMVPMSVLRAAATVAIVGIGLRRSLRLTPFG